MKVTIINIGDELLNGQLVNTNATWMSEQLSKNNYQVQQILTIPDDSQSIKLSLHYASEMSQVIFITGGLGPTNDDITVQTLSEYFNCELKENHDIRNHIIKYFHDRGVTDIPQNNFKQTMVWEDADVIPNAFGTAFGIWKIYKGVIYIVTPGVPFEMKEMLVKHIIPKLQKAHTSQEYIQNGYLLTLGIGESILADRIKDIEQEIPPHIGLAYLPRYNQVLLRITGKSTDFEALNNEIIRLKSMIQNRIPEFIIAEEDIALEKLVINELNSMNQSLSIAESCTGGKIASMIVSHTGSSKIFMGSVVSYSDDAKINILDVDAEDIHEYGAVSKKVAISMAENTKMIFKSDYAISTTGIAGPTGATTTKPVGLVWIAIAGKKSTTVREFHFKNDRLTNIDRTAHMAFKLLRELYIEENTTQV